MIILLLIQTTIAIPIPNNDSGSGSQSGSQSEILIHHSHEDEDEDEDYNCETGCKVLTYIFLSIISCFLLILCLLFIFVIYEVCIKECIISIRNSIRYCCISSKNFLKENCIPCNRNTTREITNTQYIQNHNYQNETKDITFYDKFIAMYNSMYNN